MRYPLPFFSRKLTHDEKSHAFVRIYWGNGFCSRYYYFSNLCTPRTSLLARFPCDRIHSRFIFLVNSFRSTLGVICVRATPLPRDHRDLCYLLSSLTNSCFFPLFLSQKFAHWDPRLAHLRSLERIEDFYYRKQQDWDETKVHLHYEMHLPVLASMFEKKIREASNGKAMIRINSTKLSIPRYPRAVGDVFNLIMVKPLPFTNRKRWGRAVDNEYCLDYENSTVFAQTSEDCFIFDKLSATQMQSLFLMGCANGGCANDPAEVGLTPYYCSNGNFLMLTTDPTPAEISLYLHQELTEDTQECCDECCQINNKMSKK